MARRPDLLSTFHAAAAALEPPLRDVVVAVSGGPDSVALLRALASRAAGRVIVAHLDHGWRGEAALSDRLFVERLAKHLGVECRVRTLSVADSASGNREAAARTVRYAWLGEVAQGEGVSRVATGHTSDDQAETVLFRMLRGCGIGGLSGIAFCRTLAPGVELVRPLLAASRSDVLEYLTSIGQDYCTDATNADTRLTRNRIRHELLPLLVRDYNPGVADALARLATQAAEWQDCENGRLDELLCACERPRAGDRLVFDGNALAAVSRGRLRGLWRRVWRREDWPRDGMGFREYDAVAGLCLGEAKALDLPGAIRVRAVGAVVQAAPVWTFKESE